MYRILVIDDQRIFDPGKLSKASDLYVVHCTTSDEGFVTLVTNQPWDEVWLDHDLGLDSTQNGYEMVMDVIDAIESEGAKLDVKQFWVHSMNPVGARRMVLALTRYFKVARIDPTPYLDFDAMYANDRDPYLAGPMQ